MATLVKTSVNGTGHQTTQVPARLLGIQVGSRKTWSVMNAKGGDRIVEETPDGKFNIIDCLFLDFQGLRRLHAVLGYMLADDARREEEHQNDPDMPF